MEYPDRVQFFIDKGFIIISHTPPNYQHCKLVNRETNIYAETVAESAMISYNVPKTLFVISSGWFQNMHPNFDKLFYFKLIRLIERIECREFSSEELAQCEFSSHEAQKELSFNYCSECGEKL